MNLMQESYLGNTLQAWLIALSIFIVIFVILKIIQAVAVRKLSRLALSTDTQVDDLLVSMLKQTKLFILLIASAYLATLTITLKPSVSDLWEKIVILALILQAGFWASAGIAFAIGNAVKNVLKKICQARQPLPFWDCRPFCSLDRCSASGPGQPRCQYYRPVAGSGHRRRCGGFLRCKTSWAICWPLSPSFWTNPLSSAIS